VRFRAKRACIGASSPSPVGTFGAIDAGIADCQPDTALMSDADVALYAACSAYDPNGT
jgi:hypothetical protein